MRFVALFGTVALCLSPIVIAGAMAMNGIGGWGWFLALAILILALQPGFTVK